MNTFERALVSAPLRRVAAASVLVLAALTVGGASASLPLRVVLGGIVMVSALLIGSPGGLLVAATLLSFCVGLVRRVLSGEQGRVDNDLFVVLPLVLVVLGMLVAVGSAVRTKKIDAVAAVMLAVPSSVLLAVAATGRGSTTEVYAAVAQSVP